MEVIKSIDPFIMQLIIVPLIVIGLGVLVPVQEIQDTCK